ncbi:MAG: MmgE/PrpD family protein [Parvularcula sp.]|jgi:2-methylcitrate dehydratase PrpD|nr:MmgE/PrpD family protein [Parvularcula sp.]
MIEAMLERTERLRTNGLPPEVMRAVKTFVYDSLGVGIAGAAAPLTQQVRVAAAQWHGRGEARLLGGGPGLTPAGAAFVNGFQIHCQEYDCVHEAAVVHPMATVLAALLAEADAQAGEVNGRMFSEAVALSVELATTIGVAATSAIRFFRPANAGIFGSALGISYLRGFTEEQTRDALGYALALCSGTMQAHVEGKPALPVQIGNAAHGAVMAADLAKHGLSGPQDSLEGAFGYFALFEEETDVAAAIEGRQGRWRITEVSHKPFPTGRAAHGGLVLLRTLRERIENVEDIEKVCVTAPPLIPRLVERSAFSAMKANHARLCFPYLGAVMLKEGAVTLNDFTDEALARQDILALAERIEVMSDGSENPAAFVPQKASIALRSGTTVSEQIDSLLGSPAHPLSDDEAAEKFRSCLRFGLGQDDTDRANAIGYAVAKLDSLEHVSDLLALVSPEITP